MMGAKGFVAMRVASRMAAMGLLVPIAIITVMAGEARAGCGDGACGRVDWTEVTDTDEGAPAAAKLHGNYAWEASPDFWRTHPIAGVVSGYFWLTCRSPTGSTDAVCRQQLATEMSKAGTHAKLTFGGNFFDIDAGVTVRPEGLFEPHELGKPRAIADVILGTGPINPDVCPAAFGTLPDGGAGAGGAGAGGAGPAGSAGLGPGPGGPGPTSGGAAPSAPPSSDDGGCSTSRGGAPANGGMVAFVFTAVALEVARRRSRD